MEGVCMKFVRAATIEEVLRVSPEDESTRDIVRACPAFGVWSLGREDIGNIGAQLPSGELGTISSLFAEWKAWLRSPDPRVVWSADVYGAFVQLLREGESFSVRPIVLGSSMQIHDGRHRLFAAFEFLEEHGGDRSFEVFWDRVP
jgi:hypothetical protein